MLFHVTTGLSWPARADARVVAKSVSAGDRGGRNGQFWDKHGTIGNGGREKREKRGGDEEPDQRGKVER